MKKALFLLFFLMNGMLMTNAQSVKAYSSVSGEMIFSFATIGEGNNDMENVLRWSPFFNLQGMYNVDFGNAFGLFTGLGVRNVGFITKSYEVNIGKDDEIRTKYRTYNLGIPIGIKLGKLDMLFIYGGYEIEFPFHYKEKRFVNGEKTDKITGWFSDRVEPIQHSVMAGIQFPLGFNLKFKYYLTNLLNKDFETYDPLLGYQKPYDFDSQIFYFSLCWNLFSPLEEMTHHMDREKLDLR